MPFKGTRPSTSPTTFSSVGQQYLVRLKEPVCPGGPLNLRGFELRGAGPSADGSALGGSMYWASGLHLYTPLPFRPGRDGYGDLFKTHVFVTAGNVGNFGLTGDLQRDLDQVLNPTFTSTSFLQICASLATNLMHICHFSHVNHPK